jgi:hypothetical protein
LFGSTVDGRRSRVPSLRSGQATGRGSTEDVIPSAARNLVRLAPKSGKWILRVAQDDTTVDR